MNYISDNKSCIGASLPDNSFWYRELLRFTYNEHAETMYSTVFLFYCIIKVFFNIIFSDSGLWKGRTVVEPGSYFFSFLKI